MKQNEVEGGKWYLFARTMLEHRQHLIGNPVHVLGRDKKRKNKAGMITPQRYRLEGGGRCIASELQLLAPCKQCKGEIKEQPLILHYMMFCSESCLNTYKAIYSYKPQ